MSPIVFWLAPSESKMDTNSVLRRPCGLSKWLFNSPLVTSLYTETTRLETKSTNSCITSEYLEYLKIVIYNSNLIVIRQKGMATRLSSPGSRSDLESLPSSRWIGYSDLEQMVWSRTLLSTPFSRCQSSSKTMPAL